MSEERIRKHDFSFNLYLCLEHGGYGFRDPTFSVLLEKLRETFIYGCLFFCPRVKSDGDRVQHDRLSLAPLKMYRALIMATICLIFVFCPCEQTLTESILHVYLLGLSVIRGVKRSF